MRYLIRHETALAFPKPVREHQCELRLVPRDDEHQRVLRTEITVRPECHLGGYVDCFGNRVTTTSLIAPHDSLAVRLEAEVETLLENPFAYAALPAAQEARWLEDALGAEPRLLDFLVHRSDSVPDLRGVAGAPVPPLRDARAGVVAAMQETMAWAAATFRYETGTTDVHAPLETFLGKGAGV